MILISECVPRTISYRLYFRYLYKVWSILENSKECYFMFTYTSFAFFFFHQKICCYHFHFFFWWSIQYLQQNIDQLETRICEIVRGTVKDRCTVINFLGNRFWSLCRSSIVLLTFSKIISRCFLKIQSKIENYSKMFLRFN